VLLASAALEALRLYRLPFSLPNMPGGALGDVIGQGLARALGFNGATLLLIARFGIGWSLPTGLTWLRPMERVGPWIPRLEAPLLMLLAGVVVISQQHRTASGTW